MKSATQLGQEFGRYVMQITTELLMQPEEPASLSQMERDIRAMLLRQGRFLLGTWLSSLPVRDR